VPLILRDLFQSRWRKRAKEELANPGFTCKMTSETKVSVNDIVTTAVRSSEKD